MINHTDRGCLLPLAQSLVSGLLTALLAYAIALWADWEDPIAVCFVAGAAGAALWWWWNVLRWSKIAYPELQPWPESDDQVKTPVVQRVRVELKEREGQAQHVQIAELDVDPGKLAELARGLLDGQTFSEGVWTGAGRPFTRAEFHQLRRVFIQRGWATFRNSAAPAQGVTLTRPGLAVMRSFSSIYTTPPYQD